MNFNLNNYYTSDKNYTHLSLKGGKYNVPSKLNGELFKYILKFPESCLCEALPEVFPLYFDIDGLPEEKDFSKVLSDLDATVGEVFDTTPQRIVLVNNSNKRNFHIFYSHIMVTKKTCRDFCNYANDNVYEDKVLDNNAYNSCFRMPYVSKYVHKNKTMNNKSFYVVDERYNMKELTELSKSEVLSLVSIRNKEGELSTYDSKINKKPKKRVEVESNEGAEENIRSDTTVSEVFFTEEMKYYTDQLEKNDYKILNHILYKCLSKDKLVNVLDWCKIGYILKNLGIPKSIFIRWSKTSPKYEGDDEWINKRAELIFDDASNDEENKIGIKTLLNWARNDNAKEYKKIIWGVNLKEYINNNLHPKYIIKCLKDGERGDAKLFVSLYKKRIVCINTTKNTLFYYWDGNIWKKDDSRFINVLFSEKISNVYLNLIEHIKNSDDNEEEDMDELLKLLFARIASCNKYAYSKNVINFISHFLYDTDIKENFDKKKDYLSVKNGLIDLRTGTIRPRNYDDYNTFFIDVEYKGKDVDTSGVNLFFSNICLNRSKLTKYLQKFLGYSVTGNITEQKFSILHGIGSNGKSLTIKLLTDLLEDGKYVSVLSGDALSSRVKGGNATTQFNKLDRARIAFLDESDKNQQLNEGLIKRFSGGSKITIRKLYQEEETIDIQSQFILVTNHKPKISNDYAFHRRLLLFPFEARFVGEKKFNPNDETNILKLPEKEILKSVAKENLLSWIVEGSVRWYNEGMDDVPTEVSSITEEYIKKSDSYQRFIIEECEVIDNEEDYIPLEEFLQSYNEYTGKNVNLVDLKDNLKERHIDVVTRKRDCFIGFLPLKE